MSNSVTLWTLAHRAPLSMGFSRQEYWSGLPFPSPKGEFSLKQIHLMFMSAISFLNEHLQMISVFLPGESQGRGSLVG